MVMREKKKKGKDEGPKEVDSEQILAGWVPKTRTGKLVMSGEITSLEQVYDRNLPILEPQILDKLVPGMLEEVLDVHTTSRTTDSGRKRSFLVTAAVGNRNGCVGVGIGRGLNVRPAIERAVEHAKLNMMSVRMGCGSWECGCGLGHSLPYKADGKCGSVRITLIPAPKGTGLVAGGTARKVLELAGVKDAWTRTGGDSRTVFNFAMATLDALRNIRRKKYQAAGETS